MTALPSAVRLDVRIEPHHKGFPPQVVGKSIREVRGSLALTRGDFTTPVLLLSRTALDQNLRAMRDFCEASALSLAPHVKTTMSPEIISAQFEHGAWAATVANRTQAATVRAMGIDRILVANEVIDPQDITWLGEELDRDENFTTFCYVDSAAGVVAMETALASRGQRRPVPVLVEYGVAGGRTGVRTAADALHLAGLVANSPNLQLTGVAGFEGVLGTDGQFDDVTRYLRDLRTVADAVYQRWAGDVEEFVVTAGGSLFIELVRDEFSPAWRAGRPIRVVLRSGCYATHDSGACADLRAALAQRTETLPLVPALELWARVLSRPEPELAIVDLGKRDAGLDAGFPRAQHVLRRGTNQIAPSPPCTVTTVNDQHAYVRITPSTTNGDMDRSVEVGDLIGFGISHPCTTFDKWRLIPIVDDDRTLVDIARTWF